MGFRQEVRSALDGLVDRVARLDAAIVVRDPGTARSVEAYDGLRRSVVNAVRARRQHLGQLVSMTEAIDRGASIDDLKELVAQWRTEAGLDSSSDTSRPEHFEVIGGRGEALEVVTEAWLDVAGGDEPVLFKRGTAMRVPTSEAAEHEEDTLAQPEGDDEATTSAPGADPSVDVGSSSEGTSGDAPDAAASSPTGDDVDPHAEAQSAESVVSREPDAHEGEAR